MPIATFAKLRDGGGVTPLFLAAKFAIPALVPERANNGDTGGEMV